jgi:NADPH:quinone reductase
VDASKLAKRCSYLALAAGLGSMRWRSAKRSALGARVLAAAGSTEKVEAASQHGADEVINYRNVPRFREWVKNLTNGAGADVVLDPVGGDAFDESLRCIAWRGRILVFGFASGRIPNCPTTLLLIKGCQLIWRIHGRVRKEVA